VKLSGLRVIAGSAKGRKLKRVPGEGTRPISDRVKESLFDILGADIVEARVLDLFAGTGGVGIEALSRGAAQAVFVESDRLAVNIIHENLRHTDLAQLARVVRSDVFIYLRNEPRGREAFDYVHVAPPQYHELWNKTLMMLDQRPSWVNPDGVVVAQIDPREYAEQSLQNFTLVDRRRYGSTLLCFYERTGQ
jgi:16S rRNA (guanine(966)-N(2))-methyltransferase RsmD